MMLGVANSSGDGGAAVNSQDAGGDRTEAGAATASAIIQGGFGEEDKVGIEEGERSGGGGNRWPRQETLALLKIRSDMDVAFRDSSLKGPLWEEVSRKMAELGYQRSSKKCKEKFENVYKYHKRTKDGRASKADGKTYRFFDQLQALEHNPPLSLPPPPPPPPPRPQPPAATTTTMVATHVTVSSTPPNPVSTAPQVSFSFPPPQSQPPLQPPVPTIHTTNPPQSHNFRSSNPIVSKSLLSNSTSSSTSSDEDIQRRHRRKRKWMDIYEKLMKDVIEKQEEMQKKFLETLEKRERDRITREEAWRVEEMAKMNQEHELLVQERSIAAAKDAAVIAFLQKITQQHNLQIPISNAPQMPMQVQVPENPLPLVLPPQPPPQPQQTPTPAPATVRIETPKTNNGGENLIQTSSSRWPKTEVQALINLRTDLDLKYQENGPKGPLWEEISAAMTKLGYNRSAKRCKEKWENINKYFKKVKESNKKRPGESKTCPYFEQLDAIYKEKSKNESPFTSRYPTKPENPMVPLMVLPEQQWPLQQNQESALDDHNDDNDVDDGDDNDDEEDEGGGYEIATNKQPSSVTTTYE